MPLSLERLRELQSECLADDLELPAEAVAWIESEARAYFESGGVELPRPRGLESAESHAIYDTPAVTSSGVLDMPSSAGDSRRHATRLVNGAVAGAVSKTVVSPLERVRLVGQTTRPDASALASARNVLAAEGWSGMWRGNGLAVARAASSKAILFAAQDALRVRVGHDFVAGSLAGVLATLLTYPLDLLRTRAAAAVSTASLGAVTASLMREGGGVRALYRGVGATAAGAVAFEGTRFGSFGWLQARNADWWLAPAINGTLASLLAGMVMYPNDTVRRRIQWHRGTETLSYLEAARALLCEGGVARLYRGGALYALKSVPSAAVQFGVYHGLKRLAGDVREA